MDALDRLSPSDREHLHPEGMPGWLDPMLATLTGDHFSDPDWLYERKLDGSEARTSGVRVFLYLFDLLHLTGYSTRQLPLRTRKSLLREVITSEDPVRWVPHRNEHGEAWLEEACRRGWEGLIAKRADAPYHHGRSRDWLKFKCVAQQELVIGGFTEPEGERDRFGALLVGYYDDDELRYAGKVGTGYDDRTLGQLGDPLEQRERTTSPFADDVTGDGFHWVTPELVAQVGFTEWTDDGRLRHPRFLGLRDDKDAEQVVRETPDQRARPDRSD